MNNLVVYANDSAGNTNSSTINWRKDSIAPSLSISSPLPITYGRLNVSLNYSVSDSGVGLSSCWYRNDTDPNNITILCGTNVTIFNTEATHTIYLWANDTLNNINSTSVTYSFNLQAPSVVLSTPLDNLWSNSTLTEFNFTATDPDGISTCQLWGNWTNWHLNQTLNNITSGILTNFTKINILQGKYIWNVWCNDTLGNGLFSLNNYTLNIDTTNPNITLVNPVNNLITNTTQNFTANISDNYLVKNYTLNIYNYSYCYQETSNQSTSSDGNCGLLYTGAYSSSGNCLDWTWMDGNWSTSTSTSGGCYMYTNYTTPPDFTQAYWLAKAQTFGASTFVLYCYNYTSTSWLQLVSRSGHTTIWNENQLIPNDCISSTIQLRMFGQGPSLTTQVYEEAINWTIGTNTLINQTTQNANFVNQIVGIVVNLVDNFYTWFYQTFDNAGNSFTSLYNSLLVDTISPSVIINTPNVSTYNIANPLPQFNYTISDKHLQSCKYSLNGINTSISCSNGNRTISPIIGNNTLILYANDTAGNLNQTNVTFYYDNVAPLITIITPINTTYSNTTILLNVTSNENISQYTYTFGAGNTSVNPSLIPIYIDATSGGSKTLRVYGTDLGGNTNYSEVTFYVTYTESISNIVSTQTTPATVPEMASSTRLISTVTTDNTIVNECNFTLTSPTRIIINNTKGTNTTNTLWYSNYTLINESGDYTYSSTCTNQYGYSSTNSNNFTVSAISVYYTSTFYLQAENSTTETKTLYMYLYDNLKANVSYNISMAIDSPSYFTLSYPTSASLTSTDSASNPVNFNPTINGSLMTPNGTYYGNLTITSNFNGQQYLVSFLYTIFPPAGIPKLYDDTTFYECNSTSLSSDYCANYITITQGQTQYISLKAYDNGNYGSIGNCTIFLTEQLAGASWITGPTPFSLKPSTIKIPFMITIAPTTSTTASSAGVIYEGHIGLRCNNGNSLGQPVDNYANNWAYIWIRVIGSGTSGGGGGGTIEQPINRTTILQCIKGNGICEDGLDGRPACGENFQNTPDDCQGDLSPLTDCFTKIGESDSNCFLIKSTATIWIIGFVSFILLGTFLLEKKRLSSTKFLTLPAIFRRRRKRYY
jgi:hypothetical protein